MTPRSRYGLHRLVIATAMLAGITTGCTSASTPTSTNTSSRTSLPAGARTQTWLAYQAPQGADDRVFLVRDDGSDAHAIADALPGRTGHPDFSRDGHHLVIDQLTDEGGVDQVYVSDQDGKDPRLIARCRPPACLGQWEPAWSPDGHRLAVSIGVGPMTDHGPAKNGVATIDLATERVTPLLVHPSVDGQDHFARWSPDGSAMVFWRERISTDGAVQTAIFRIDATGKNLRQLTPWSLLAGEPDWSPDGSLILFSTRPLLSFGQQGPSELYLMSPDGTAPRQITHLGASGLRATQPRWTADGKSILYVRSPASGALPRHVYKIQPDGTRDTAVLTQEVIYTHPATQPNR